MLCNSAGLIGVKMFRLSHFNIRLIYAAMDKCGVAGDIGSIGGRLIVRNVFGGDMANAGAWPWHAVISLHRNTVTSVS